ncbi:MAG: xanthine dehydrogenase family protein molybdopterin-binding subunit, partial [Hyphomicrobiaceae bacterium]
MQRTANRLIGAAIERFEDTRFLRGRGTFIADLKLDGMLHAAVLRSTFAHGRIRSIDTAAALSMPGVRAVITAGEIGSPVPRIPIRLDAQPVYKTYEQPVIADGKVRYVGEPIALVVADSQAIAEDALREIDADIEPLPALVEAADAMSSGNLLFEASASNAPATIEGVKGDVEAAFADAPYTRSERFRVHRHSAI